MRVFLSILISLICAAALPLAAQAPPAAQSANNFERPPATAFSESQGKLGWDQAIQKCTSLKMRLPSLYELHIAYQAKMLKDWEKGMYWTATDDDDVSMAYVYFSNYGVSRIESKGYSNFVRCVK